MLDPDERAELERLRKENAGLRRQGDVVGFDGVVEATRAMLGAMLAVGIRPGAVR